MKRRQGRGRENMIRYWEGRKEALSAGRMNGSMQPWGERQKNTLECTRDLGHDRLSELKRERP